jgi:hypothetical protein
MVGMPSWRADDTGERSTDVEVRDIALLRHFLATLAYRTQKAIRGAPPEFAHFQPVEGVRTPAQIVRHMSGLLGYVRTLFVGAEYRPQPLETMDEEVLRFHDLLKEVSALLDASPADEIATPMRLLQGPLADAMTHVGQIALLRRLYGIPIPAENFLKANIRDDNLGPEQPDPVSPGRRNGRWDRAGLTATDGPP